MNDLDLRVRAGDGAASGEDVALAYCGAVGESVGDEVIFVTERLALIDLDDLVKRQVFLVPAAGQSRGVSLKGDLPTVVLKAEVVVGVGACGGG
jgi:hypothetical protein